MARAFQSFLLLCLLAQAFAYRTCRIYHSHGNTVTEIKCTNSEYCCDHGCCRKVYTIWYFWTLLLFGLFVGIIFCWWYKAYKHRQRTTIVQRSVIPMQVVQPYPHPPMNGPNRQTIPGYPPYASYAFAPPPYSVAMNQESGPPPNYYPPNHAPKAQ
ncbi:Hypothetical predicted protein [Paramuricea clavata]|uniref:Uncharacterized protein n=1 Tax=Paramuricea clavata TaxID=317549 RepID=A0A6S7GDD3_PARCT|nr:Hypothetical predicted protein [Paramuricea clavata]